MSGKYTAIFTAFLILSATSLAQAQQSTSDTTRPDSDRARDRDQRALTTDTMKLHHDVALRDSARAILHQDQVQTGAVEKQIDSLQAVLQHDKQATPRDTAAIARDKAALTQQRNKLDRDLDQARREKARVDLATKAVQRESHAAMETRQDIREDKPKSPEPTPTPKKH